MSGRGRGWRSFRVLWLLLLLLLLLILGGTACGGEHGPEPEATPELDELLKETGERLDDLEGQADALLEDLDEDG